MNSMTKLMAKGSPFELISAAILPKKDVVQIWPAPVYTNDAGYAVFLCEVENDKEEGVKNGD